MSAAWRSCLRELLFIRSHPWELALATWVPLLFMALFEATFSHGVARGLPVAIVDEDHSTSSRELIRLVQAAPAVRVVEQPASVEVAQSLTRSARAHAVLYIPDGFQREVLRTGQATVTLWFNASYQTAGGIALRDVSAAVSAMGAELLVGDIALRDGAQVLRAPPIRSRVTALANPQGSYERLLLPLLFPALLHTMLSLCVIAAVGREMRDGTVPEWFESCRGSSFALLCGKILPYIALFTLHGVIGLLWLNGVRGWPVAGSVGVLILAMILLFCVYSAIGIFVLGSVKRMSTALSLAGIYAGAGLAFCGGIFPVDGAPLFTRLWSGLLPLSTYVELQTQQLFLGAPVAYSLPLLGILFAATAAMTVLAVRAMNKTLHDARYQGLR